MNGFKVLMLPCFALVLGSGIAFAQDEDPAELTMTLMTVPEGDLPEAVTAAIELPADASEQGVTNSAEGLAIANDARERRLEGLATAAEARERGAEFGAEIAENARDQRGDFGRGVAGGEVPVPDVVPPVPDVVPELSQPPVTPPIP